MGLSDAFRATLPRQRTGISPVNDVVKRIAGGLQSIQNDARNQRYAILHPIIVRVTELDFGEIP